MLAALLLEAYILFRKGVKTFRWLCLEKEFPAFMKSHFSLEEQKDSSSAWGWANYAVLKVNTD